MANGFEVSAGYQFNPQLEWSNMQDPSSHGTSPQSYLQLMQNALPSMQQSWWASSQLNGSSCRNAMWSDSANGSSSHNWQDDRVFSHKQASSIPPLGMSPPAADLLAAMLQAHSLSQLPYHQTNAAPQSSPRSIPEQPSKATRWPAQEQLAAHASAGTSCLAANQAHALSMLAALSNAHSQQLSLPMTTAPLPLPLTSTADMLSPSLSNSTWFNGTSSPLMGLPARPDQMSFQHHLAANGISLPSSAALAASMLCNAVSRADSGASAMSTGSSETTFESTFGTSPTCSSPGSGSPSNTHVNILPCHAVHFHPSLFQQQAMPGVHTARSDVSDASTDTLKGGSGGEEEFSEEEIAAAAWERSRTLAVLGIKYDGVVSAELRRSVGAPFQHLRGFVGVYMPAMSLRSCKTNRRSRSFAFIKFSTPDAAAAALDSVLQTCPDGTVPILLPGAGRSAVRCQVERVQEKSTADLVQKYRSFVKSCQRLGLYHLLS